MSKADEKRREPNFKGAASIIRSKIMKAKEDGSKIQGELSDAWSKVEGCGVNKKAAKDALKLHNMSSEGQQEYLRSLYAMMGEFNIALEVDLVDQAEGEGEEGVVPFPTREREASESALLN